MNARVVVGWPVPPVQGKCAVAGAGAGEGPAAVGKHRAGLAKVLVFLKPGDCLMVWRLDRLGRSLSHPLATVNELKAWGRFRSQTEQMDTTTPLGRLPGPDRPASRRQALREYPIF